MHPYPNTGIEEYNFGRSGKKRCTTAQILPPPPPPHAPPTPQREFQGWRMFGHGFVIRAKQAKCVLPPPPPPRKGAGGRTGTIRLCNSPFNIINQNVKPC